MKIVRDGKEYELTEEELVQAWNEIEDRNLCYDIKDEFEYLKRDCENFRNWSVGHKGLMQEMISDAFVECDYRRGMYGSVNVEDVVWEMIEDHDLKEMFE